MAQTSSRQSQKVWKWLVLVGLSGLLILILIFPKRRNYKKLIIETMTRSGYSMRMAKIAVAIAAHETNGFTSEVMKKGKNLFGMTLATKNTLAVGVLDNKEGQAIFDSYEDSAKDFVLYLGTRFKYPKDIGTVNEFVAEMQKRGYFTADQIEYENGVNYWYNKYKLYE